MAKNKEAIQYKILAGDTSNLSDYDSIHYFHSANQNSAKLNPRFDSPEGLLSDFPNGLDCIFIIGSGPVYQG